MNQPDNSHNFLLYTDSKGDVKVNVYLQNETIWLTQKSMAELFNVNVPAISKHLSNIYEDKELDKQATLSILETVQQEGKREVKRKREYYNLDAIISVGYRVNSYQATQFRIWATRTLKEFIIKGFVLDDERLKKGKQIFDKDYFDELLERIREIRASERRFYQKITDLYALSIDYDNNAPQTKDFFASVQNKLHWAITGKTAAEIIYASIDDKKLHLGLTSWKNAPDGKILKSDVSIAKNYLNESHINELNRIVSAYLELAESRAERQIVMKMSDWVEFLHRFLELSNYPILQDKGKISKEQARLKAEQVYETYRVKQDKEYLSDFDKTIQHLVNNTKNNKE